MGGVNYGYSIGITDFIRLFELRKVLQFKKGFLMQSAVVKE